MANKDESEPAIEEKTQDINRIADRLDMLDQRLDNIDSVVSALVERVMKQPITINVSCSKCGNNMAIALVGNEKPTL